MTFHLYGDDTKLGTMRPIAKLQTVRELAPGRSMQAHTLKMQMRLYASLTGSFFKSDYWNVPLDATGIPLLLERAKRVAVDRRFLVD